MSSSGRLSGMTALVTGASRGNGRAIALALAREGADVAVNFVQDARGAEEVLSQVRGFGRRSLSVQASVLSTEEVRSMVERVVGTFGHIDILVNNAGALRRTPFWRYQRRNGIE